MNEGSSVRKPATRYSLRVVGALAVCIALTTFGCEDETTQAPPPAAKKAKKGKNSGAKGVQEPAKGASADEGDYVRPEYTIRRNPFQPDPELISPVATVNQGEVRTRGPLEQFGLGELSLVAIISETAIPKAMFIDRDGFGHVVKEGDGIGRNGGIISDIRDNEVEVLEGNEEEDGQTFQKIVKLRDIELSATDEGGLTEDERAALARLLESEAGRATVKKMQAEADGSPSAPAQRSQSESKVDPRYKGFAPPK